jgi:uncharacterized protein YfaS (alpha-2-macroglobulin family)
MSMSFSSPKLVKTFALFLLILGVTCFAIQLGVAKLLISQVEAQSAPANFTLNTSTGQSNGDPGSLTFVSGGNAWSNGGVVVLNATLPSKLSLQTYSVNGKGKFTIYRATKDDLLNYLLYKKVTNDTWGTALQRMYILNRSGLTVERSFEQDIFTSTNQTGQVSLDLGLQGTGVWFIEGQVAGKNVESMIVRSNLAAIIHKGDNQNIFWVQDTGYASVQDATLDLLNLERSVTSLRQLTTSAEGLATDTVNGGLDLAIASKGDDFTILPVNLENVNYMSGSTSNYGFGRRQTSNKTYLFTDRYLYKPGDTVYFKAVVRTDDDANYTIEPRNVQVTIGDYDKPFFEKTLAVSNLGTVDAAVVLPEDLQPGYFSINIKEGDNYLVSDGFQVAQFRKPDSEINVKSDKLMYLPGEKVTYTFSGSAFLGQPIRNQDVRYKIYQFKASERGSFDQIKFASQLTEYQSDQPALLEGKVTLDDKGTATATIDAKNSTGFRQFWVIHVEYLEASGNATNDAMQVLIQPGDFVIERTDEQQASYIKGKENIIPLQLSKNKAEAVINNIPVKAQLLKSTNSGSYTVEQSDLQATSDASGKFQLKIQPKEKESYKLELDATDKQGNPIKGEEFFYVYDENDVENVAEDIFTVTTDKQLYNVGDTAKFTVTTKPEIKQIFVSLGRAYSRDYRVLSVSNGTATFEAPINEKYQPNVFLETGSFYGNNWRDEQSKVLVNTTDKKISLKITPSQNIYGPAETAQFEILATDGQGRPVQTDLAFWIFDKALLELHGDGDETIYQRFWNERWYSTPTNFSYQGISGSGAEGGGGCFAPETLVTMADDSKKRIDQVNKGDRIKTFSSIDTKQLIDVEVVGTHAVEVDGVLVVNGTLKITPEHKLLVNAQWKTAGEIAVGDVLLTDAGVEQKVSSIEWVKGAMTVHNLEVEKLHTFFAGGVYVHNDKGEVRSVFKDTAYWNPHVTTDSNGRAQLTVQLPDNLTTWVTTAVAANASTQVGDGMSEFTVTKEVVFQPILPAFMRVGDNVRLSALLYNYSTQPKEFAVSASFTAGELENAQRTVTVQPNMFEQFVWPVSIASQHTDAMLKIRAEGTTDKKAIDEVNQALPVYDYGSWQKSYVQREGTITIPLALASGTNTTLANATLSLKATEYPQLQTLADTLLKRAGENNAESAAGGLIAASIFQKHGKELGLTYNQSTLTQMVAAANKSIASDRYSNTGVWYYDNRFDVKKSRFVLEALVTAKNAGLQVDQQVIDQALNHFKNWSPSTDAEKDEQLYVFSLFPDESLPRSLASYTTVSDQADVGKAVIANVRNGVGDTGSMASQLFFNALETETQLSWVEDYNQGDSWQEVAQPTAWSLRAMQSLNYDQTKVKKVLDYLYRNESYSTEIVANQLLATVEYYRTNQQSSANYTYRVYLNEKLLEQGQVTPARQTMPSIELKNEQLQGSSQLKIELEGTGKLFSTLELREFVTDREVAEKSKNIEITRKYLAAKKTDEPTKPGDLVIVQFDVKGLGRGETAIEVEDFLPSGLVAIDQSLDNGNFDQNGENTTSATQQLTDQGIKLNFSRIQSDSGSYSYKARVVAEGIYDAPPATIHLTNEPSILASTKADRVRVDGESTFESYSAGNDAPSETSLARPRVPFPVATAIALTGITVALIGYTKKAQILALIEKLRHASPPPPPAA